MNLSIRWRVVDWIVCLCLTMSCVSVFADSEDDHYDSAVGYMGQKKYAEAETEFRKSIQIDPRYKQAWEGLANVLEAEGKDASAVKAIAAKAPAARSGPAPALTPEQALALAGNSNPSTPAQAPAPTAATPAATPAPAVAVISPLQSDIVTKSPDGTPGVLDKNGKPYDGVKLSSYDEDIFSPQIACARDGTIHVAFVERMKASPYTFFVFHRQSTDGGKTWSEPKNLSEDMTDRNVGTCALCIDGQDRVFVIWRSGLAKDFPASIAKAGDRVNNLVYRMLDHGRWTKILPVHSPGSTQHQDIGSFSFMACTDAAGHVQVIYNTVPDRFDPQKYMWPDTQYHTPPTHCNGIQAGLVFEATLDGTAGKPSQLFCANFHTKPGQIYGKYCDGLDTLSGFVDAAGAPHFLARDYDENHLSETDMKFSLFENNQGTHVLTLPSTYKFNANPPAMLVDAAGKKHVIVQYDNAERPSFRDYVIGSDDEPTALLTAKPPSGACDGFQAFQGPGGNMIVLMQMMEDPHNGKGNSWITTSNGGAWTQPVCITNNAGRASWVTSNSRSVGGISISTFKPAPGAAAYDSTGHLVVALINVEMGSWGLTSGTFAYAGAPTATPRLYFFRF